MRTVKRGDAIPLGISCVTPGERGVVKKFCLSFPFWLHYRRGYHINSDAFIKGWWGAWVLFTVETFRHASLRCSVHFGWRPRAQDLAKILAEAQG